MPRCRTSLILREQGSSGPGLAFAGKHAEVIFVAAHRPDVARSRVEAARNAAKEAGRNPAELKVLALLCPIVSPAQVAMPQDYANKLTPQIAETDELAEKKHQELFAHGSDEGALALFGGWTGIDLGPFGEDEELRNLPEGNAIKSAVEGFARQDPSVQKWTKRAVADLIKLGGLGPIVVGSPASVADQLESWIKDAGCDGFKLVLLLLIQAWLLVFSSILLILLPFLFRSLPFTALHSEHLVAKRRLIHPPRLTQMPSQRHFAWHIHRNR